MKLKCHNDCTVGGFLILESEPQVRTLFVSSELRSTLRVKLPHILFIIRYQKYNNKFIYPGLYGNGLNIACSFKSIQNLTDEVYYLPTDYSPVCTNHAYDNKIFDTTYELANFVISLWWGTVHSLRYQNVEEWCNTKNVEDLNFRKIGSLQDYLKPLAGYCSAQCFSNINLCNNEWKKS